MPTGSQRLWASARKMWRSIWPNATYDSRGKEHICSFVKTAGIEIRERFGLLHSALMSIVFHCFNNPPITHVSRTRCKSYGAPQQCEFQSRLLNPIQEFWSWIRRHDEIVGYGWKWICRVGGRALPA